MHSSDNKVGAVLVVGAGIGGMQASLDLAEAGFKVYLVERDPAIGGRMAQLDKTFPTNDCSMCILSPKLVDVARHLNIEIMTYAELESIEGEPGNFKAYVRQKPRYVIADECTACNDCAAVCPVVCPDQFNMGISERRAAYKLYPQATPNAYVIEKRGTSPCRTACPAGVNVQGFIALLADGKIREALDVYRQGNPFPATMGRICTHPCELACNRGEVDQPLASRALHRFLGDWAQEQERSKDEESPSEPKTGDKVAIVGSGPAGLTCARDLAQLGYRPTVFEALPVAGGMLRVGIPRYRLPEEVLQREIDAIAQEGVEIRTDTPIGPGLTLDNLFAQGYKAIFVATGTHKSRRLNIEGEDLLGVLPGVDFLQGVKAGQPTEVQGKTVLVIGGGNTAVDAARTSLRLGAEKAVIVYRRSREEMPAAEEEITACEEEGVEFLYLAAPKRVLGERGMVTGLEVIRMELGEPDSSGRRRPIPIEGSEFVIEAQVVIPAVSQEADLSFLADVKGLAGTVDVDEITFATSVPGIFAGGDVVGLDEAAVALTAIRHGHEAAISIDRYLRGEDMRAGRESKPEIELAGLPEGKIEVEPRVTVPTRDVETRVRDFEEVELGYTAEQAIAEAKRCLNCGICSGCLQCVAACQKHCIDHDMQEEILELDVGAVILSAGVEAMPGGIRPEFGYGRWPNVVTSMEFERMLSASGPWGGVVRRPSDGKHPHRVAFIQCVGSRDESCGHGYCSSVCCMYTTKEALVAKEHDAAIEPTVFYIDIRAFGKGFERYIERAEHEQGVRYVRSMVSAVAEVPGSRDLRLSYTTPDGAKAAENFDLVVLSVGLQPSEGTQALAQRLGIELNEYGFAEPQPYHPGQTIRPDHSFMDGIFVAGGFSEPKDIPDTVIEASCAAAQASALLADVRGALTEERVWPEERDVGEEAPRIGVFVCHCGINIGSVVDVPSVMEYAASLPYVAYAEQNTYTCSEDTQQQMRQRIQEHNLNRLVVASCTPRTHEPLFQDTVRAAGLNPHLFQMTNIREQDSWVHKTDPERATEKAKELVAMAVAKARQRRAIAHVTSDVNHRALVIGGGLAGMTAALSIAEQGFDVTLVEQDNELGGNLRHLLVPLPGARGSANPQQLLQDMLAAVSANPRISVRTGSEVVSVSGYVGQYRTTLRLAGGEEEEIEHGAIVVATGARQTQPKEYLYGQDPRVVTQRELEERIADPESNLHEYQSMVMIQCVGSRDKEHPYCSRMCCTEAIKNALAVKERNPKTDVYILYRDIRTFGFLERYYREAREKGVIFVQYREDQKPQVQVAGSQPGSPLKVAVWDPVLNQELVLQPDVIVLSAGIEPNIDDDGSGKGTQLSQVLRCATDADGFFQEAHVKLRPLDFATDGVYLCGLAHSPRFVDETIAQAKGAAMRVVTLLSKSELEAAATVASVDPLLCTACGQCVEVCPYDARVLNLEAGIAEVIEVQCQGCGACVTACPNKASQQKGFEAVQIYDMLDALGLTIS